MGSESVWVVLENFLFHLSFHSVLFDLCKFNNNLPTFIPDLNDFSLFFFLIIVAKLLSILLIFNI